MTDNEYVKDRKYIENKLSEHSEDIVDIRDDLVDVKIVVSAIPKMAETIESIAKAVERIKDRVLRVEVTGVHKVVSPRRFPDWAKVSLITVLLGGLSLGGLTCAIGGADGFNCGVKQASVQERGK